MFVHQNRLCRGGHDSYVDAGTRSVGMMFRAVVFTFMPTAIELILVCTLLAQRFRPAVALAVLVTFVAYVSWTTVMTKVCIALLPTSVVH